MKLRLMVYVGMLAACGAALGADVIVGKQTCAAMAVPATGTYTLIAVPFKDVGGKEAKVKVADVVKTVGLKAGSHLFYYTGENYYAWKLEEGTWKGAAVSYKKNGKDEMTQTPEDGFQVPCGATLWLQRAEESEEGVVLYGEEAPVLNPTLTAKSVQLISNPKATDYTFTAAAVTGRENGNYSSILTLDVGEGAGITVGMPVVCPQGLVGRITEVGKSWSRVTTIVEAQSAVGAYVERSHASGIVEGDFTLSGDGICRMSYLPADSDITEGDRILTSGYGDIYPRGLVVGYVRSVTENPYTRSLVAEIACAAPISALENVMIVTSFTQYAE